jgi:hypothetical protein
MLVPAVKLQLLCSVRWWRKRWCLQRSCHTCSVVRLVPTVKLHCYVGHLFVRSQIFPLPAATLQYPVSIPPQSLCAMHIPIAPASASMVRGQWFCRD